VPARTFAPASNKYRLAFDEIARGRAPFAGGDQQYLRNVQYGTSAKLAARIRLLREFSTAEVAFRTSPQDSSIGRT
jgi:hypothetical protein